MKTCNLSDFMKSLSPWLDDDYIRKACLDENGHFVLLFTDGVKNVYNIEDCKKSQLEEILEELKKKGIPVEFSG
jgi:predicted glycosyltransferase